MQRYFIPAEQLQADTAILTGEDARHLARVMRGGIGDKVICSNGEDREVLAEIRTIGSDTVELSVVEELPMKGEPAHEVWIGQSLPKGDKLETVIQKCTELGAARFVPFVSERTVVQYDHKKETKRLQRWQKIAIEAAEQAHRSRVPEVAAPCGWKDILRLAEKADIALFCYEKEHGRLLKTVLQEALRLTDDKREAGKPLRILVLVGPEGGFSEREAEEAEKAGCRPIGLGARILRTETAAMAALACILYETGAMGE